MKLFYSVFQEKNKHAHFFPRVMCWEVQKSITKKMHDTQSPSQSNIFLKNKRTTL